ncbi:uncharacterized protein OCT59_025156 [Rhizophagus irregularis]|uniref:uncharacterized protein n=1 Tax=Rhizophagus irregularis TaxID=588596 RepID=UPI003326616F|nr:hypothetical protein OCT59_025156 [Rhizophagus irregularis]
MITSICEKHLEREFIRELSPNIKCFDLMDFEYNHDSIQIKSTIKFFRSKTRYPQLRLVAAEDFAILRSPGVSPTWSLQVDLHVKSKI